MAGATTCPECGGRVGAYAAGCEHCGADLEAHARRTRAAAASAPPPRGPSRAGLAVRRAVARLGVTRLEVGVLLLVLILLAYLPALALVPAALAVMHGLYEGRRGWTVLFVALVALAFVLAFLGYGAV